MILVSVLLFCLSVEVVGTEDYVYEAHPELLACPSWTIQRQITITSPLFPEYAPYFYCEYVIKAPKGKHVAVTFREFSLPKRFAITGKSATQTVNLCEENYLAVKTRNLTQKGIRYCGDDLRGMTIISEESTMVLTFQSMPFKDQSVRGFKADVQFRQPPDSPDGQQFPCGRVFSTDTALSINGSALPCYLHIGSPAIDNKAAVFLIKSETSSCSYTLKHIYEDGRDKQTRVRCNERVTIEKNTKTISLERITDKGVKAAELSFSEKIADGYVTCGGTKSLEMEIDTDIGVDLKPGPMARCLWIIETPRRAREIIIRADAMQPKTDFHHLFHMIVFPRLLQYDIMLEELRNKTYHERHMSTSLPMEYRYKFSELETESKALMVLIVLNNGNRKFSGTVTALGPRH